MREDLLTPHIEAYTDVLERGARAEHDFLAKVCNEYHAHISWRLADTEEPSLLLPAYDPYALADSETLTEEEKQRYQRIEELNVVRRET